MRVILKGVINVISRRARVFNEKTHQMEEADIPEELIEKVDDCKNMITEAVAETDEVLLDKYFNEGTLSDEEIYNGLIKGCSKGGNCSCDVWFCCTWCWYGDFT